MRCISIIIALVCLLPAPAQLLAATTGEYPRLRESFDPRLQRGLEDSIDTSALRDAVVDGKLALALVDITDIDKPRYAAGSVRANRARQFGSNR